MTVTCVDFSPTEQKDVDLPCCENCKAIIDFKQHALRVLRTHKVTQKEEAVVLLLLKGLAYKEIASALGNTEKTIKSHIASVFGRFDVKSRGELMAYIFPI